MADEVKETRSAIIHALGTDLKEKVENEEPYDARVSRTDL